MTITATVVADSISAGDGVRLTTLQLRYPRFIHAEFMTHRAFSRNASSSRAIPVERLIEDVVRDPAGPVWWGKNQPGMQAREEHVAEIDLTTSSIHDGRATRETAWLTARDTAIHIAHAFSRAGYHKQIVNRLLEPFSHINVVVTATEWDNFFALRRHPDAQPEIHELADRMWEAMSPNDPTVVPVGSWHLPYVSASDRAELGHLPDNEMNDLLVKVSAARCARVSYLTHDGGPPSIEVDLMLYDRLAKATPAHASPMEHQATPDVWISDLGRWLNRDEHGNLRGWRQHRKMIERGYMT